MNKTILEERILAAWDAEFSGQNKLTQAILGALEYRGFNDCGKYLDDDIAEKIAPIIKQFLLTTIQEVREEERNRILGIFEQCGTTIVGLQKSVTHSLKIDFAQDLPNVIAFIDDEKFRALINQPQN